MKASKIRYILVMTFIVIPLLPIVSIVDIIYHMIKHSSDYWSDVWYDVKHEHIEIGYYLKQYFLVIFNKKHKIDFDKKVYIK